MTGVDDLSTLNPAYFTDFPQEPEDLFSVKITRLISPPFLSETRRVELFLLLYSKERLNFSVEKRILISF